MVLYRKVMAAAAAFAVCLTSGCLRNSQVPIDDIGMAVGRETYSQEMEYDNYLFYKRVDKNRDGIYDYAEISDFKHSPTEINIPYEIDGLPVKSIGEEAFSYYKKLTSITIPDSVLSIGEKAFASCTGLTSLSIPDGVKSIGDKAFYGCSSLTGLSLPDSVKLIGEESFSNCSSLKNINVSENNNKFSDIDGVLFNKKKTKLIQYPSSNTRSEYIIPDSVSSIGEEAFYNCSNLKSLSISDGMKSIGDKAFYGCSNLKSLSISDGVESIGDKAFYDCSGLTSLSIPDSVKSIGYESFSDCSSLENINVSEANNKFSSIDGVLFDKEKTKLIQYPNGNTRSEYIIPDSVTSIEEYAFCNCSGLKNITIPDKITSIESMIFSGCSGLKSITISGSVKSIGEESFSGCSSLENINVSKTNNKFSSIDGVLFNKEKTKLIQYPNGNTKSEYIIPDSVTSIEKKAFYGCSDLTKITIPDGVTSIGEMAFYECEGLTSLSIPDSVISIENSTFSGCTGLTSITIPDSVTSIGQRAFYDCIALTSITIHPECVIGGYRVTICNGYDEDRCYYSGVICGYKSSTAQAYAEEYGYTFEDIDGE